jgi:hypothetical protein
MMGKFFSPGESFSLSERKREREKEREKEKKRDREREKWREKERERERKREKEDIMHGRVGSFTFGSVNIQSQLSNYKQTTISETQKRQKHFFSCTGHNSSEN